MSVSSKFQEVCKISSKFESLRSGMPRSVSHIGKGCGYTGALPNYEIGHNDSKYDASPGLRSSYVRDPYCLPIVYPGYT